MLSLRLCSFRFFIQTWDIFCLLLPLLPMPSFYTSWLLYPLSSPPIPLPPPPVLFFCTYWSLSRLFFSLPSSFFLFILFLISCTPLPFLYSALLILLFLDSTFVLSYSSFISFIISFINQKLQLTALLLLGYTHNASIIIQLTQKPYQHCLMSRWSTKKMINLIK